MQEEAKEKKVFYQQVRDTGADINAIYTQLGPEYDVLMDSFGDVMSTTLRSLLESHFPDKEARSSLSVYEVGVGTGRLAEVLV